MRIAMMGTRGVPARYGGFETAIEEIGSRLADDGHDVVVYCRGGNTELKYHKGMQLVHLPAVKSKQLETLSHMALSSLHVQRRKPDVAFVFNAANAPLLPILKARRIPVVLHMDGLEWQRAKWGKTGRRYYLASERIGTKLAEELIADARGISDYYRDTYSADTAFIPYGAPIRNDVSAEPLRELGLEPGGYHVCVARFEPENHVDLIVEGYSKSASRKPLVVVGAAPFAKAYTERVEALAAADERVRLLGSVWDQDLLDALYAHAASYLHGHSVGGTNPSLLRAMGLATPVTAFDVNFNREVLGDYGVYFSTPQDVADCIDDTDGAPDVAQKRGKQAQQRAADEYQWDAVAAAYGDLAADVVAKRAKSRR